MNHFRQAEYSKDQSLTDEVLSSLHNLEIRVSSLEGKEAISVNSPTEIKDGLRYVMGDSIADIVWDDFYYFSTLFESVDGWSLSDSSVGGVSGAFGGGVQLRTGNSSGSESFIVKYPQYQNFLTFNKESRFRTAFYVNENGNTLSRHSENVTLYIGHGNGYATSYSGLDPTISQYGFYVSDSVLYGVTGDGKSLTQTVLLPTFNYLDVYAVEARHFPGERVDFYVSDPVTQSDNYTNAIPIYRTSISKTLPTRSDTAPLTRFHVRTQENNYKEVLFTAYEMLQKK